MHLNICSRRNQQTIFSLPGPVVQSVASPTADPGVMSLIPARSHTFMEIDHEIISMVSYKQKYIYVHEVQVNPLVKLAKEK